METAMAVSLLSLVFIGGTLALFGVETWLAVKQRWTAALILPLAAMILTIWLGPYCLIMGALLYLICGVAWLLRRNRASERKQMDIQDL